MKLIFDFVKKYKWAVLLNFIMAFGFILIELGLPTMFARIIDDGVANKDFVAIKRYGLYIAIMIFVGTIGRIIQSYLVTRITNWTVNDIRRAIFKKTRQFAPSDVNTFGVSSLITRTNNDAYQIMMFLQMGLRVGITTPIMLFSSLYMAIRTSRHLSLTLAVAFPLLILAVVVTALVTAPISRRQQKNLDGINRIVRETLMGLRVVRAFSREEFQQNRFEDVNKNYTEQSIKLFHFLALAGPAFGLLMSGVVVGVLIMGTGLIIDGTMKIGIVYSFIDYIFHSLFSFMLFTMLFTAYPRMAVSAERIREVLETEIRITSPENPVAETEKAGYVEFRNVTFAYHDDLDTEVLHDVSFTASPGETVAFIGSTGSGKSSIVKLVPRFHEITGGQILIDDVDIRALDLKILRQKIGYVPQRSTLFTGSIRDNLLYGNKDATDDELLEAAKVAQSYEFISSRPDGFDTYLSEGGSNLSGGQKQRLAITRALVRKPEIYIFDDSFSALDYRTDARLREALRAYTNQYQATVLLVAQRVGTIMNADKIIVLDKGKVVAQGTHKELLKTSEIYYEIAASQLSKEELA